MKNNFIISFDLDIVKLYIQQILHSAKSLMCNTSPYWYKNMEIDKAIWNCSQISSMLRKYFDDMCV